MTHGEKRSTARIFHGWKILGTVILTQALASGMFIYGFGVLQVPIAEDFGVPRATVEHDYLLTNDFVDYENDVAPRLAELLGERAPSRAEALALSGVRWLGAITPLGGVAFIAGWACLAFAALRISRGA